MISPIDICVPLYNEEFNIHLIMSDYQKARSTSSNVGALILVDNGSTDRTSEIISNLRHESVQLHHIEHNIGYGGGAALAIEKSQSKNVALIPANNQYPFAEITKMIDLYCSMKSSNPTSILVKGKRIGRRDPIGVQILSRIYTILTSICIGKYFSDANGMPKIFEKDAIIPKLKYFPRNAAFDAVLLLESKRQGTQIKEIPITYLPRLHGQPSWKNKRIKISLQMLISILQYRFKR